MPTPAPEVPVEPIPELPAPAPVAEAPAPALVAPTEVPTPVEAPVEVVPVEVPRPHAPFSSLYSSQTGTLAAIICGMAILVIVQIKVARIFGSAKSIIEALTYFATSMVAVLVGIYICDLLIAGPEVLLLREGERSSIVNFVKDTCLMVFAYFFGTKSAASSPSTPTE